MKTSSSFELISHPDRTLAQHLDSCEEISALILGQKYVSDDFYQKSELEMMRQMLVYFHDLGKASDFFQYRILTALEEEAPEKQEVGEFKKEHQAYLDYFQLHKQKNAKALIQDNDRLTSHARLGSHLVLLHYQHQDSVVEFIVSKVIRRHHGCLTNFASDKSNKPQLAIGDKEYNKTLGVQLKHLNVELYNKILSKLQIQISNQVWHELMEKFDDFVIDDAREQLENAKTLKYFFLQHYLFSLLLSADKGDMMLEKEADKAQFLRGTALFPESLIPNYKADFFRAKAVKSIDLEREKAFQEIHRQVYLEGKNHFFSITLPTGMGKTFCAFHAAIQLQHIYHSQYGTKPKIIYCLPFTSVIDQNADILTEIVESQCPEMLYRLTKHHYLANYNDKYDEEFELKNDESEYLTTGWEHDFIVTTFVQLLESIFTNKNRAIRKFHNMTNAIIILDEVQNIPPKYFKVVEQVFKSMSAYFGTKFLFVTATQPFLFGNQDEVVELCENAQNYFQRLDRIALHQDLLIASRYKEMPAETVLEAIAEDIAQNPELSFLVICNTIAYAQELYFAMQDIFKDVELLFLSGSLLPIKRLEIIKQIKNHKEHNPDKQLVVISTQVVEAGVDIDLDVVYRDLAPMDSINQSAGRCNRNGIKAKGRVCLFHSGKAKNIYDATLLDITLKVLQKFGEVVPEARLYELNQHYARAVREKVAGFSDTSKLLVQDIQRLALEDIERKFKYIEDDYPKYDVFIPFNEDAKQVWQQYIQACKISDDFERKREVKKIKPRLLQYVTRFPKQHYTPTKSGDEKKSIINESCWEQYYDLNFGFKPKITFTI